MHQNFVWLMAAVLLILLAPMRRRRERMSLAPVNTGRTRNCRPLASHTTRERTANKIKERISRSAVPATPARAPTSRQTMHEEEGTGDKLKARFLAHFAR
ncbi:hypothetical protein TNIN_292951 [Trichonephila inaurata madagascariensis]|uniref:Secreted protein n=1 Tax=Trichonephila inaurata madagascariensis TaxID=2747483 RepID=A0A8X6YFY0_9ARAC|nr:hypothetical protein TNIN_292951 [Trichonephila inaurata madagascariensis]